MGKTKGNYHNLEVGQSYDSKPASINLVEPMAEVKGGVRRRGWPRVLYDWMQPVGLVRKFYVMPRSWDRFFSFWV